MGRRTARAGLRAEPSDGRIGRHCGRRGRLCCIALVEPRLQRALRQMVETSTTESSVVSETDTQRGRYLLVAADHCACGDNPRERIRCACAGTCVVALLSALCVEQHWIL